MCWLAAKCPADVGKVKKKAVGDKNRWHRKRVAQAI